MVQQPGVGRFQGLDAGDAVELGELLAFVSDWLASDPNRLDASLYEFVGVPDYVGRVCSAEELRGEGSDVMADPSFCRGLGGQPGRPPECRLFTSTSPRGRPPTRPRL